MKKIYVLSVISLALLAFSIVTFAFLAPFSQATTLPEEPLGVISNDAGEKIEETEQIKSQSPLENVNAVYYRFSDVYWQNNEIGIQEISDMLQELATIISYELGLDLPVIINLNYDTTQTFFGVHYNHGRTAENFRVDIYISNIYNSKKPLNQTLLNTLAHELRHEFQLEQVFDGVESALTSSYLNYISPSEDYEAYWNQLAEVDAREFANYYERLVRIHNNEPI